MLFKIMTRMNIIRVMTRVMIKVRTMETMAEVMTEEEASNRQDG